MLAVASSPVVGSRRPPFCLCKAVLFAFLLGLPARATTRSPQTLTYSMLDPKMLSKLTKLRSTDILAQKCNKAPLKPGAQILSIKACFSDLLPPL